MNQKNSQNTRKARKKITKHRKAQKDLYHTLRDLEATPLQKNQQNKKKGTKRR
jgi:hypothetical protein